jgi:hypothetical protein
MVVLIIDIASTQHLMIVFSNTFPGLTDEATTLRDKLKYRRFQTTPKRVGAVIRM